jgi:hypothetical protein
MEDSYHTLGAQRDRAAQARREDERNRQLARIADALETYNASAAEAREWAREIQAKMFNDIEEKEQHGSE